MSLISTGSISLDSTFKELMRALSVHVGNWDGICKSFMEPRNRSLTGGPVQQHYLSYRPATLHSLAESILRNRFLGSINVYKYGLWCTRSACASEIIWRLTPPKIKITSSYFIPKVTYPQKDCIYGVKLMKIRAIENLTLGHLSR